MPVFQQKYIFSNFIKLPPKEGCLQSAIAVLYLIEISIGLELQAKKKQSKQKLRISSIIN